MAIEKTTVTIILDGTEQELIFDSGSPYYLVTNTGGGEVYASPNPGIVPEAKGVISVPAGTQRRITAGPRNERLYICGTGKAEVEPSGIAALSFSGKSKGGDPAAIPKASEGVLGVIMPDGTTVTTDANGVLSAKQPLATYTGAANHNTVYRGKDITEMFNSGRFSENVADGSFDDIFLGDYIQKPVTIGGTVYNVKGFAADCDLFFRGYDNYAIVNTHHVGLFIVGLPNHKMNSTNNTTDGYIDMDLYHWLNDTVLPALKIAFGADHLVGHKKMLGDDVNTSAINKSNGAVPGATSHASWIDDQEISLLTEPQIIGTIIWSSSPYDIGEGVRQLSLFKLIPVSALVGVNKMWVRGLACNCNFVCYSDAGHINYADATLENAVCPLILLK